LCRILVVGYEGFQTYWPNPAGEIAASLDGALIGDCKVRAVTIPVELERVRREIPPLLPDYNAAIGIGLDPRAFFPRLELAAVNIAHFRVPDNSGKKAELEKIVEDGPQVLPTGLPFEKIYYNCKERNLPLHPGLGTGTFLCNTLAYTLHYWSHKSGRPAGFIHIPLDTHTAMRLGASRGLPRWLIRDAIICVLESIAGGSN
jgi:pyroglutamyl-peptidase